MTLYSPQVARPYQAYIDELQSLSSAPGDARFAARQLLELHAEAAGRAAPTILELGVGSGQSTRAFLNAIAGKPAARLISVDIEDCSGAAASHQWTFVQGDSGDAADVLARQPVLRQGIDILYVDSLHKAEHVLKEVGGYYPYLNAGAVVFLDDVDSFPYMFGQRKDNVAKEIDNRAIDRLVERIFWANRGDLDLTLFRGSTGLARLDKCSPRGAPFLQPLPCRERQSRWAWRLLYRILGRQSYKHHKAGASSLVLDPGKYG